MMAARRSVNIMLTVAVAVTSTSALLVMEVTVISYERFSIDARRPPSLDQTLFQVVMIRTSHNPALLSASNVSASFLSSLPNKNWEILLANGRQTFANKNIFIKKYVTEAERARNSG